MAQASELVPSFSGSVCGKNSPTCQGQMARAKETSRAIRLSRVVLCADVSSTWGFAPKSCDLETIKQHSHDQQGMSTYPTAVVPNIQTWQTP